VALHRAAGAVARQRLFVSGLQPPAFSNECCGTLFMGLHGVGAAASAGVAVAAGVVSAHGCGGAHDGFCCGQQLGAGGADRVDGSTSLTLTSPHRLITNG
jgi:hypothetical protein